MAQFEKIIVETLADDICRVQLNSPENANSQDVKMLYELNEALMTAARDDRIRVIILGAVGKHFSAGHDLRKGLEGLQEVGRDYPLTSGWSGVGTSTIEGWHGWEHEMYLDMCRRWRAIAKPVIAQVQGGCIGGGLMVAWTADLIVASEDAFFQDPVVDLGVCGVEYFAHIWEIGSRRAKEKLFTADRWSAKDALEWGMVNHVVPRQELEEATLALARRIAAKPSFGVKLTKELVNSCLDQQGFSTSIDHAFALHQLCHAQNRLKYGTLVDPTGLAESVRRSLPDGKLPEIPALRVEQ
ncbi:enoyl-CoA hydratase [Sphingobium sp. TKS]|uniref:enoyl-CoA hydratase n=1 Tax=Sphingobium sp. TKS TaxID=1315974 RepID=UPI000770315D|nr:enoyl-CoA hydratase [Sphingobium sp. TKS]AMK22963.1 enoyl-CoA hydratase [Sphingobium sp. TKS]